MLHIRISLHIKFQLKHGFKNVWTQDGRIMYWDAVSDRVKLYYN